MLPVWPQTIVSTTDMFRQMLPITRGLKTMPTTKPIRMMLNHKTLPMAMCIPTKNSFRLMYIMECPTPG